ncbi:hypothetical protein QFZ73_002285 [Peribacillus sp. V2I11]|nr:hypothetical protein [Peribacillus sp. V2I11]
MCLFYNLSLMHENRGIAVFLISKGSFPGVCLRKNNHILKKTVKFEISWP